MATSVAVRAGVADGVAGRAARRSANHRRRSAVAPVLASRTRRAVGGGHGMRHPLHSHVSRLCVAASSDNGNGAAPSVASPAPGAALSPAQREGLIFTTGVSGSWDEASVGNPVVRYSSVEGQSQWCMWYAGATSESPALGSVAPVAGSIGVAMSDDGVTWTRGFGAITGAREQEKRDADVGKIMEQNEDWWWMDTCHLAASDVQVMGDSDAGAGVFWMFYSGADWEAVEVPDGLSGSIDEKEVEGLRMRPGLALSQDGKNFARIEGDHHSGALFDVGEKGEWDELFIGHPQVLTVRPKDMRMYYHSYDAAADCYKVGLAVSTNGFRWEKKGVIFEGGQGDFDARGAAARHVVRNRDGDFVMFYEAVAKDDTRSIGMAISKNGLDKWTAVGGPVLAPSGVAGAWDGGSVGTPRAVPMADSWRLYYAGRAEGEAAWTGIGMALSEEGGAKVSGMAASFRRRKDTGATA
eukprot:jgi/Tetstr1/445638/TSEL_003443.t1